MTTRSHFRRRGDAIAVVVIIVACLATGLTAWAVSDARHTVSETGPAHVPTPAPPAGVPDALRQLWQAPSAATPVPVAVGPTVVTADDGAVLGRDPGSGDVRWRYSRDLALCTVAQAWSRVLAVYRKGSGWCSEVTALDATTGARGPQRNGNAELGTRLIFDGTYVTATGENLLPSWRSDLVRTMEYGNVPDYKIPDAQPRPECRYGSVAAAGGRVGVIERCPGAPGDRLTVYQATAKDSDKPSVEFSTGLGTSDARLVAMTDKRVAVASHDQLAVFDAGTGNRAASYPLRLPESDLSGDPPGHVVPSSTGSKAVYWYTGSATIALSRPNLRPLWTDPGTLGPGTTVAGSLLLPVPGGLAVADPATGTIARTIPVDRDGYRGTITLAALGHIVLEQRGDVLVALGAG